MTNTEETTPELTWRVSRQHSAPQSSRAGAAARSGGTSLRPAPAPGHRRGGKERPAGRTGREVANDVIQVLFIHKEHSERARRGKVAV